MQQPFEVRLMDEARLFLQAVEKTTRIKFSTSIRKTQAGDKGIWFKKIKGTDFYEFRVEAAAHTYRLFAFWDTKSSEKKLIVCTHGLDKKSQKLPLLDLQKAARLRAKYFGSSAKP